MALVRGGQEWDAKHLQRHAGPLLWVIACQSQKWQFVEMLPSGSFQIFRATYTVSDPCHLEAIASRVEAIARRLEAIARLEGWRPSLD